MILYRASEQRLADWSLAQSDPLGLFPKTKGYVLDFCLHYPESGTRPYFLVRARLEEQTYYLLPIGSQVEPKLAPSLIKLEQHCDQLVLLSDQANLEKLLKIEKKRLVLSLTQSQMELAQGDFLDPRLEFRLIKNQQAPESLPALAPLIPWFLDEEIQLVQIFMALFRGLNQAWWAGQTSVRLEELYSQILPLYLHLSRSNRKEVAGQLTNELTELCLGPLRGWLEVELFKKKPQSQPFWRARFLNPAGERTANLQALRAQSQALQALKTGAGQMSYYDQEIEPL